MDDDVVVVLTYGAALVVVVVVLATVVVVVEVGNAKVVVDVEVVLVEVVDVVVCAITREMTCIGAAVIAPILNCISSWPSALVKKLVLAIYLVPPISDGTVSVNNGP